MWDLFTKVLLKLHGEMGMPGRKGEKDQYSFFFFFPPSPLLQQGGNVGDETSCKCGADYDCLPLRYARSSQGNTFIQTEQQMFDEFLFGT